MRLLPGRLGHREPMTIRLEPPVGEPFGFILLARDQADGVLAQARRLGLGFNIRDEAVLVFRLDQIFDGLGGCAHGWR